MNTFFHTMSLLAVLSTQTVAQAATEFPARLVCDAVGDCIEGFEGFCKADVYFPEPRVIENPARFSSSLYDPSGTLSSEALQKMVMLDFRLGDQYSFYFFDAQSMTQLARGMLQKIQGTYEDGFDWTNGYNTRAKFQVECTAQ